MIHVFTGNGKGKSTSAIGMGIRAVGAKKRVLMIQFLKNKSSTSENKVIEKVKSFEIKSFGRKGFFLPLVFLKRHPELKKKGFKPLSEKDSKLAKQGLDLAEAAAKSKKYNLLILDEINVALNFGLIDIKEVLNFLKKYGKKLDIVLTGRYCPKQIIKIADLITDFREVKHYYKKGVGARKGIEY